MGLDMYAHVVDLDRVVNDFTIRGCNDSKKEGPVDHWDYTPEEYFYWRKNYTIHEWMKDLYYKKGGTAKSFNCEFVRLTNQDIDDLESFLKQEYSSFTNTEEEPDITFTEQYEVDQAKQFFRESRIYLEEGKAIYYYSWW